MQTQRTGASFLKITAAVFVLCAMILFFRKEIAMLLRILLGAGVISFILDPLAALLARRIPRPRASLLAMLFAAGVLILSLWLLFPPLAKQFSDLLSSMPAIISRLNGLIGQVNTILTERGFSRISLSGLDLNRLTESLSGLWAGTARFFGTVAGGFSTAVLSCILAYYFLAEKSAVLLQAEMLFPCRMRKTLARMGASVRDELRSYLRSQALICLCVGALSALLFAFIGIQGAPALGILVGLANCIPYFGPLIGGVPAVICALTGGLIPAALTAGALLLVQQMDNMFITPRITGGATGLPPPAVMLSVLAGGSAFGWAGMLLAVPFVCTLRCIWRVILMQHCIPDA